MGVFVRRPVWWFSGGVQYLSYETPLAWLVSRHVLSLCLRPPLLQIFAVEFCPYNLYVPFKDSLTSGSLAQALAPIISSRLAQPRALCLRIFFSPPCPGCGLLAVNYSYYEHYLSNYYLPDTGLSAVLVLSHLILTTAL